MSNSARHKEKRRQHSRLSKAQREHRDRSRIGVVMSQIRRESGLPFAKDIALAKELGLLDAASAKEKTLKDLGQ